MQLFSAGALIFQKKLKDFDPQNMQKQPSKVAQNRAPTFFYALARLPNQPRNRNPVSSKDPQCRTGYVECRLVV